MININASNYVTLGTINSNNAWQSLLAAIENAKKESDDGKVCVDFYNLQLTDNNAHINALIFDENVKLGCIKQSPTHIILRTAAMILLHDNAKLEDKFNLLVVTPPKTLSKKDKAQFDKLKRYKQDITNFLDNSGQKGEKVFCRFTDIALGSDFNNLRHVCVHVTDFFRVLKNICKERNIKEIIISLANVDYSPEFFSAFLKTAIREYSAENIKIVFTDCTKELNDMLRLHMKLIYNNGSVDSVKQFVKELGLGRVVLLTKLKDHRTTDISYREKDEVIAQYIAIISEISDNAVKFKYCGFNNLKTYHDLLAYYGSTDEFDEELNMRDISVPFETLGCTNIRIASSWHLNLLNGDVASSAEFNYVETNTSETIKYSQEAEKVVLPEFIRRSLRSWHIQFNERAMLIDIAAFKKTIKYKKERV